MAFPILAAVGAAAVGAAGSVGGALVQAFAARQAEARARAFAYEGKKYLEDQYDRATPLVEQGYSEGQDYLKQAGSLFDQERELGRGATDRLKNILLGGDMSQLQLDPSYAFRMGEGNKAIERAAIASGSFGSGANLKELTRYGQNYASQEFNNALNRLSLLANMGSAANVNYANVLGKQSALGVSRGQDLANLLTSRGSSVANLLTGQAANSAQYNLQAANAIAQGLAGATNAIRGGLGDYAYSQGLSSMYGAQGPVAAPPPPPQMPSYSGAYGAYPGFTPQMSRR